MGVIKHEVRWAINAEELKKHLKEGLNQIEATRAGAERMAQVLGGDKLIAAAHRYAAGVQEIGGANKLTAAEQDRVNAVIQKAIEKYTALGQTAPAALMALAEATKRAVVPVDQLAVETQKIATTLGGGGAIQNAKAYAAAVEQIGGVSKLTKAEQAHVNAELQKAIEKYRALGQQAPAEILALEKATRDLEKTNEDTWKKAGKQLTQYSQGAKTVGLALTAGLTAPLLGMGAIAVKAAMDFESSFAGVRKTVDGVVDELGNLTPAGERLRQGFRDLAKEIPVSVNELNRIGEAAGALGIKQEDILSFTKTIATIGVTTNLSADQAANAVARIQNIFGAAGKDTDRLASALVALGNAGASTESEIVEMGLRIAGAGKIAGLAQSDVLGIANALSSVGVEAEAGGTAVQKMLIEMTTAVANGGEQLETFARTAGMSGEQFRAAFKQNAAGAFTLFVEGLKRSGDQAIGVLAELGLQDQRLIRSFLSLAEAGDLLRNSIDLGSKAWDENTAANKEAEQRFKTFEMQLQPLKNKAYDVAVQFGDALLPILRDLLKVLEPAIETAGDLAKKFSELPEPLRLAAVGFGALVAGLGPAIYLSGQMAGAITTLLPLMKSLASVELAAGLAKTVGALSVFANPVVAGVMALLAGGALSVHTFRQSIAELDAKFKQAAPTIKDFVDENGNLKGSVEEIRAALGLQVLDLSHLKTGMQATVGPTSNAGAASASLAAKLAAARKEIAGMSEATRRDLVTAIKSGAFQMEEMKTSSGLSELALKLFKDEIEETSKKAKDADTAQKKFTDSIRNLTSAAVGAKGSLGAFGMLMPDLSKNVEGLFDRAQLLDSAFDENKDSVDTLQRSGRMLSAALAGMGVTIGTLPNVTSSMGKSLKEAGEQADDTAKSSDRVTASLFLAGEAFELLGHTKIAAFIDGIAAAREATMAYVDAAKEGGQATVAQTSAMAASWIGLGVAIYQALDAAFEAEQQVKRMQRVFDEFGTHVSESTGEAIKRTFDDLLRHAAETGQDITQILHTMGAEWEKAAMRLNLARIIDDDGGLRSGNLARFMRELVLMLGDAAKGIISLSQAGKVLDDVFDDFAKANTDRFGFMSQSMREIIDLTRELGIESEAVNRYLREQADAAAAGFNAIARGAGTSASSVRNLGILALATFDALIKQGYTYGEALRAIAPGLQSLQQSFEKLGLNIEDAGLKNLLLQAQILEKNPELLDAVDGLTGAFAALSNMGLLNADTFKALQQVGAETFERIKSKAMEAGASEEEAHRMALLAVQSYLQAAQEAAEQTGQALDENTQLLIDQSKELGIWKDKGKSATDLVLDGMKDLIKAVRDLINELRGMPSSLPDPFSGWTTPTAPQLPSNTGFQGDENNPAPPPGVRGGGLVTPFGIRAFSGGGFVEGAARLAALASRVHRFAMGGTVGWPVTPPNSQDTVPAWVAPGELIMNVAQQGNVAGALLDRERPRGDELLRAEVAGLRRDMSSMQQDQPRLIARALRDALQVA